MRSPSSSARRLYRVAVDLRAVRGAEVGERRGAVLQADLRVPPRCPAVVEHHLASGSRPIVAVSPVEGDRALRAVFADRRAWVPARHAGSNLLRRPPRGSPRSGCRPSAGRSSTSNVTSGGPTSPHPRSRGVLADHRPELLRDRGLGMLEPLVVVGGERELEVVRRPDLVDPDGAPGVHLLDEALRELDGLHAGCGTSWRRGPRRGPPDVVRSRGGSAQASRGACGGPVPGAYLTPGVVAEPLRPCRSVRPRRRRPVPGRTRTRMSRGCSAERVREAEPLVGRQLAPAPLAQLPVGAAREHEDQRPPAGTAGSRAARPPRSRRSRRPRMPRTQVASATKPMTVSSRISSSKSTGCDRSVMAEPGIGSYPVPGTSVEGMVLAAPSSGGRRAREPWLVTMPVPLGRVAELADAQDSGSCVRKDVGVQLPPRPPARLAR